MDIVDNLTLQNEIASLLFENLNVEVPSVHEDLLETGLLDSLKIVELLVELEQRFGMRIPLKELEIDNFRSVIKIAHFVANHKGGVTIPDAGASASPLSTCVRPSLNKVYT